jgi:hypothetical protein
MSEPRTLDVSALPPGAFGSRSLTFWGTLGIVLIESTVFVLAIAAYFYLAARAPAWPPDGAAAPALRWGTWNTLVLLASLVPNELARRAAEQVDLTRVRIWLVVALVFALAFNVIRVCSGFIRRTSSPTSSTAACSRSCCSPDRSRSTASWTSKRTPSTGTSSWWHGCRFTE